MVLQRTVWIVAAMSLASAQASAQAPSWHLGTFNRQTSACACHLFARDAMLSEGLTVWQDTGSVLLGGNNKVVAQVVCIPNGGQVSVAVSAFSVDSSVAELTRNNVRSRIVAAQLFDTCP